MGDVMKKITLLLFFILFLDFSEIFGQVDNRWKRFPVDYEIQNAYTTFKQNYKKRIFEETKSNGSKILDYQTFSSSFLKYHWISEVELKYLPEEYSKYMISGLIFLEKVNYTSKITGTGNLIDPISFKELELVVLFYDEKNDSFYFSITGDNDLTAFDYNRTKSPNYYLGVLKKKLSIIEEFDPRVRGKISPGWASDEDVSMGTFVSTNKQENSDSDTPWTVIIGALTAAVVTGIIRRRKKLNAKEKKNQKKEKNKKESVDYILQLNHNSFNLKLNEPQNLVVKVWKVTEKGKHLVNASIRVTTPTKALKIMPFSNIGTLDSQLTLKDKPTNNQFNITITATAEGNSFQKLVKINAGGEKKIIIKTTPDNKRTLRPNIDQTLICYAKVVDENDEDLDELTKQIVFDPRQSQWIDLSENPTFEDGWASIYVGASDPDGDYDVTHPPKSIVLEISVAYQEENKTIKLQNNLEIQLLDCMLETNLDTITFPDTKEQSEITFKAYIENCEGLKNWQFKALYMKDFETPDNKPLTKVNIENTSETAVKITLTGPIQSPKKEEQFMRKLLVVSAFQEDEKPIERHLYVMVSKEGLFIEKGVNKNNELTFTASGNITKELEFGLFKYNEDLDEVVPDKDGLKNLSFELLDKDKKKENLNSVLKLDYHFDRLVTTIPKALYILEAEKEIPGFGDIITLKYRVTAPITSKEDQEKFQLDFNVNIKTYGIGEEFPDWVKAYNQCLYVISNYVPRGAPYNKLSDLLEKRKYTLGAEGLTELRNRIWKIASNLILAEGAKGYKSVDNWATAIEETLEWTRWAGDLAFNAVAAFYLKGLGAVGASMVKETMVEALVFYTYDQGSVKDFANQQLGKIIPLLVNVAKGRLISVENIQLVCKNNKAVAWAIFTSCEFLYNLYQTKSVVEAAKLTAKQLRDELIIRFITKKLHAEAARNNIKIVPSENVKKVLAEVEGHLRKNRLGQEFIDRPKMLELLSDPVKIRTLKKYAPLKLKKAFDVARRNIHIEHDKKLIAEIAKQEGINPEDLDIDDFRTPGTDGKFNLNTDRDYRLLKRFRTADGREVWLEVPTKKWKNKSYKIFGEITHKPSNMTDLQWAEHNQQRGTDRYDSEACADYTDHFTDAKTGKTIRVKPNIINVTEGKATLIDPDDIGRMYKQKVINAGETPEAFAQAKKGVHTLKSVKKGYKKQGYQIEDSPESLKKAMKVIEDTPPDADATSKRMMETNKKLNDLGYKNVNDVMNHISNEFKNLKGLKKPTVLQKVFGRLTN